MHPPPPGAREAPPYLPPHHYISKRRSSNSFASCLLATFFLIILAVAGIITCFVLFRPQDPEIAVNSMKFPVFSLLNGTANFTFFQHVAVRNPNRYSFSHYDSSMQLLSSSAGAVGIVYIPAGKIPAGRTQYMSATFNVRSFPVPTAKTEMMSGLTMELESKMKLVGSVKVLKVFAHHVEKGAKCRVTIQVSDGSVLGHHC